MFWPAAGFVTTNQFDNRAGGARGQLFHWSLTEPVTAEVSVDSPSTLRALDPFANTVTHYAAAGDTVLLSALAGGNLSPDRIPPTWFAAGVAALHANSFTYFGTGGLVQFNAVAGPARGTSAPVNVRAFSVDSVTVDRTQVRRQVDTLAGQIHIRVGGSGTATVTGLQLVTNQGTYPLSDLTPPAGTNITGPAATAFTFRWPVPGNLTTGALIIRCEAAADFSGTPVIDTCDGFAQVSVTAGAMPEITQLLPGTPIAYDTVAYQVRMTNTGSEALTIRLDSTYLEVRSGIRIDSMHSPASGSIPMSPGDTLPFSFHGRHASPFAGDSATARLLIRGTELGKPLNTTVTYGQHLYFGTPATAAYVPASLVPELLPAGQSAQVALRITHTGTIAVFDVSADPPVLQLTGPMDTIAVDLDTAVTPLQEWLPGDTTLAFTLPQSLLNIGTGQYRADLSLRGLQNRLPATYAVELSDSIEVVDTPLISDRYRVGAVRDRFHRAEFRGAVQRLQPGHAGAGYGDPAAHFNGHITVLRHASGRQHPAGRGSPGPVDRNGRRGSDNGRDLSSWSA